jgi:hypothetical protein
MSYNESNDLRNKKDAVELCGKNRGPHNYIPIEWNETEACKGKNVKRVTRLLCIVCLCNVSMETLIGNYPNVSFQEKNDIS